MEERRGDVDVTAAVGRAMSKAFNRTPPLVVSNLETTVRRIEDDYAYVGLSTALSGQRVGTAITSLPCSSP